MATCINPHLAPSTSYKKKCRCDRCKGWKRDAALRTENKELARERSRVWRLNNLERSRQNSIDYQKNNPHKLFEFQTRKYGITPEIYEELLQKQNGVCAICKQKCNYKSRLSIDHSHVTGKVRGLLCGNCNTSIGKFQDNIEVLKSAISYLERTK